jgi:serine/threonine protein kinase
MTDPPGPDVPAPHVDVGTRLGGYEIIARLGAGGMGEVYLAHDTRLGRRVALKVVPQNLAGDVDRRRRLEREAQAAARLNHPNIVTLFSFEEAAGVAFLTMEYVEGEPLTSSISDTGMPLDRLLPVAIAIADAVAAAHRAGIVHRDLKPANVMLTASGSRAKVLDFGLARLHGAVIDRAATATAPITEIGHIVGTVAYMAPEQAEGRETDARSDVFALGVMVFEMATGHRPFTGDSSISVITSILRDTPPSVTDINPGLPLEFARIVRRCLQKEPDRRYQTAVDLRNALEEVKQDSESGISASAVAPVAPAGTRRPWISIGAAVAVVTLAALGLRAVWNRSSGDTRAPKIEIHERQVTSNPIEAPVFFAAISSDGRYVAYGDIHGLHIRFVDTGETRTVPVPPEFCFT